MGPKVAVSLVVVAGVVLALGLYWEQGVLAVAAMLLLALVIVGSIATAGRQESRPVVGPSISGKGSLHLPSLSLAGAGSPLALVGAMTAAGLVAAAGLYWEQGVLAVAGMLLLAVTTVGGIARAGARADST